MITSLGEDGATCKSTNFTNTNSGEKTLILILCNEEASKMSSKDVKAINEHFCECGCVGVWVYVGKYEAQETEVS